MGSCISSAMFLIGYKLFCHCTFVYDILIRDLVPFNVSLIIFSNTKSLSDHLDYLDSAFLYGNNNSSFFNSMAV